MRESPRPKWHPSCSEGNNSIRVDHVCRHCESYAKKVVNIRNLLGSWFLKQVSQKTSIRGSVWRRSQVVECEEPVNG
jgi:hypothetical protein